jgi:hypothetical protein
MKNIQIIDRADNATFSIFQATDAEFEALFPDGQDIEFHEDFVRRVGKAAANEILQPMWGRPILKRDANGLHGTLFYGWSDRIEYFPASKREVDTDERSINEAQRLLFRAHR